MKRGVADTLTLVRREVRRLLAASPAYRKLALDTQERLAEDMVRIGAYLAEPEGIRANGLAGAITAVPGEAAGRSNRLASVNFPAFVSGLIQGVFQAIVDASIEQMEAYGDLVNSVTQAVGEFAADGISDAAARDWLAESYPECLERDAESGGLRPRPRGDCAEALPRLRLLPIDGTLRKLGPSDIEKKLVPAARRRLAAGRQQLLATMVLMGINRIVVTDGRIKVRDSFKITSSRSV